MSYMYPIQRKKLGIIVKDVSPSELTFNILKHGTDHSDVIDTVLFFEKIAKPCIDNLVARMHVVEAYNYDGPIIATCLNTAQLLINMPSPNPKFFFVNDLEWLYMKERNFHLLSSIYRHPSLTLLCRSKYHQSFIENCWNVPVKAIVDRYHFYTPKLLSLFTESSKSLYPKNSDPITLNTTSLSL